MPNKTPVLIKEMILGALSELGGVEYLKEQAINQPVAFLGLVGKVLPMQITGVDGSPILIQKSDQELASEVVTLTRAIGLAVTLEGESEEIEGDWVP